jgi:hypothetical protein
VTAGAETREAALSYVRRYRQQFPRVEIQKQLLLAGYDVATIDAALSASDAELQVNAAQRADRFAWIDYVRPVTWVIALTFGASQVLHPIVFWILFAVVAVVGVIVGGMLYVFSRG